jgi:hypothetical protein
VSPLSLISCSYLSSPFQFGAYYISEHALKDYEEVGDVEALERDFLAQELLVTKRHYLSRMSQVYKRNEKRIDEKAQAVHWALVGLRISAIWLERVMNLC